MIRTFQPVGQGTFITEQFEEGQNIVFDCGSDTLSGLVIDLIKRSFRNGEVIDGVFLSSIDREHAGGIEFLLTWCRVEKIFLPFLHEEEKALTLLKHLCEGGRPDDFLSQLIIEPRQALSSYQILDSELPVVTQVAEETVKEKNVFDAVLPMYLVPWKVISGFRVCVDEKLDWVYQPCSYGQTKRMEELTECLCANGAELSWLASAESVKESWSDPDRRDRLLNAYGQYPGPFCAVSMAVYAGPEHMDYPLYEQFTVEGRWSFYSRIRAGGLYTGNLQLSEEEPRKQLKCHYQAYLPHLGCLFLPGHGSESLYHEDILPERNAIVVATADNECTTGEPHGKVVRSIMQHQIPFYLVTELPGSTVRFYISEELG